MTAHKDLKSIIRERQSKTGESYTAARSHVMRTRAELLGLPEDWTASDQPQRVEAIVLKVNQTSARVRIVGESAQITFRSSDAAEVVPGHIVTLVVEKRWHWRGDAYASGEMKNPRVDIAKLGLVALPLEAVERNCDLRSAYEPFRSPDPYAPLWRRLTAKRRASYEMDPIAWGAFPDADIEENPTCDAAELAEAGDVEGARDLLMDVLMKDLRCIDAHAHLGNLEFDHSPKQAMVHYEIGIRIGELSLPQDFDGVLLWGSCTTDLSSVAFTAMACACGGLDATLRLRRFSNESSHSTRTIIRGFDSAGRTCARVGPGKMHRCKSRQQPRNEGTAASFSDASLTWARHLTRHGAVAPVPVQEDRSSKFRSRRRDGPSSSRCSVAQHSDNVNASRDVCPKTQDDSLFSGAGPSRVPNRFACAYLCGAIAFAAKQMQ